MDKGAIVQRDYETYAIAPQMPGGICEPDTLRKIADVADKIINYYKNCDTKKRLGRYIKEVGLEEFKKEVL